jgi:hypothetical protein
MAVMRFDDIVDRDYDSVRCLAVERVAGDFCKVSKRGIGVYILRTNYPDAHAVGKAIALIYRCCTESAGRGSAHVRGIAG